jgi:hypothetical protein
LFDLLRVPGLGRLLKWRHSRTLLQIPLLLLALIMIVDGFFGPRLAAKNLATTLSWVHFRGALVLILLCAGNFFCLGCPFVLVRDLSRRLVRPRFNWPRPLRNKWLPVVLFALILFTYELFSLWSSPWWTAWLIVGYFLAILAVDLLFKHATFCKFVCPIGQFNFIASTVSPLEVNVREKAVCQACKTDDCIHGRRADGANLVVIQRGCELALFQPQKIGNLDCTFCLDCVQACPHDNVAISSRLPGSELLINTRRSGIGILSRRTDVAALAILFTFGALMNAFGMVSPVYGFERWLGGLLDTHRQAIILGVIFAMVLLVAPAILLGSAGWATRAWAGLNLSMPAILTRYSIALTPLGFGMWLAHYGFHFFAGLYTVVPLIQNAVASLGVAWLGEPRWTLVGMPLRFVQPLQFGFLLLGFSGALMVAHGLAKDDCGERWPLAFAPWAAVCALLFAAALWLISQPMDMRATFMS